MVVEVVGMAFGYNRTAWARRPKPSMVRIGHECADVLR